jgi:ubiquitin C-terminal hydrolase
MGIKSEKTFEEIVERIIAVFSPQKTSDAHDFVDCDLDHDGSNGTTGSSDSKTIGEGDRDVRR